MIEILAMPLLGGVIGYITNDIAIKMLFRPRKAVYIGKFHVPFTPGLIPRQKERIAKSIGGVIRNQLLNNDAILETITSRESLNSVYSSILQSVETLRRDERTILELAEAYISPEDMDICRESILQGITNAVTKKISEADAGTRLARYGMEMLKEKMGSGIMNLILNDEFTANMSEALGTVINSVIREKAPEMIYEYAEEGIEGFLDKRICDIVIKYENNIQGITANFILLFKDIIAANIDRILEIVNIEQIVIEKVNSFDAQQLEQMIFGIMRRELRAIVYLGAVLGFLMGFINLIFLFI